MSDSPEQGERPTVGTLIQQGAATWSPAEQQAGWLRLKVRLGSGSGSATPGTGRRRLAVAFAGCMVVGLLVGSLMAGRGWLGHQGWLSEPHRQAAKLSAALTYEVEQGVVEHGAAQPATASVGAESATVRSSGSDGTRLRFSDGTNVALHRGARARVAALDATGARLALLDGEIAVDVVHRPMSRWRFDAGPFSVFVEGTSFSLNWTPSEERLRLQMYAGVVSVKGPLGTEAMRVGAGQTLTVRLSGRDMVRDVVLERSPPPAATAPATVPDLAPAVPRTSDRAPALAPAAVRHGAGGAASAATWRELIATGRSAEVVADAEARGLNVTLSRGRREDLAALADAARYSRRNNVARGALRALRARFHTSDSARDAAFFLGLVEESDDPRSPRALEWYRQYRREAPHGLYVSDALGREILLERRLNGDGAARTAAREYLTRFPHGALAVEAARIAGP